MATHITQTITQFPPAPNAEHDNPTDFNNKADAFVQHQAVGYVPEVNQWAVEANQLADDVNQDATDAANSAASAASSKNAATTQANRSETEADRAEAAASTVDIPLITGNEGKFLRVKPDASATEWGDAPSTFKNIVVNGDFSVRQELGSASLTASTTFTADIFYMSIGSGGAVTRTYGRHPSYLPSVKYVVQTPSTDFSGGNRWHMLRCRLEGLQFYKLQGDDVSVSFAFKAKKTGKYSVAIVAGGDSYVTSITVTSADTWEDYAVTIPIKTSWSGTMDESPNLMATLNIATHNEGTLSTSQTEQWLSNKAVMTASGSVNWCNTVGNYIEIARLQMEVGSAATEFERIPYDVQLSRVQRYYEKSSIYSIEGYQEANGLISIPFAYTTGKRTSPTVNLSTDYSINLKSVDTLGGSNTCRVRLTAQNTGMVRFQGIGKFDARL